MFKQMKKTLIAASVAGMLGVAAPAFAVGTGGDFSIQEGVVDGVPIDNVIIADSFDFSYLIYIGIDFKDSWCYYNSGNIILTCNFIYCFNTS